MKDNAAVGSLDFNVVYLSITRLVDNRLQKPYLYCELCEYTAKYIALHINSYNIKVEQILDFGRLAMDLNKTTFHWGS